MIKLLLVFCIVFSVFAIGIEKFRNLTGKEKWALTKLTTYSIMCALVTVLTISVFVFLF